MRATQEMARIATAPRPSPGATLALIKPITWFAPMWAYGCGVVSSGWPLDGEWGGRWGGLLAGVALAGPLVCGTSQAVNDWFDRHVDALNEPDRPIPSGRLPGRTGLAIAVAGTGLSLVVAAALGPLLFGAACVGLVLAWAYSAPPWRLKRNGWLGNAVVGLCYEGLPWFTGAAVMAGRSWPSGRVLALAALYSAGAHGIMTLNDFKSVAGDAQMGVRSLPVQLGPRPAARVACWVMGVPQAGVVALLAVWGMPVAAGGIAGLLAAQVVLMRRLVRDPARQAIRYNATGTSLYVLGMLASAAAIGAGRIAMAGGLGR